jgi:hypothetical protein
MNERIKELEIQCWEPRQYGPAWFNSTKFAELIVKECIEVIDSTSDNTKLMRVEPYQKIIWAIEEHFGVEE